MFENLKTLPPDPILGLSQTFHEDTNPDKINLSVGVYQDAHGKTPIYSSVKKAEQALVKAQDSKVYIAQAGDARFNDKISQLLLGDRLVKQLDGRLSCVTTPGGCGALRMGAELLVQAKADARVWVSDPTWANHYPLLQSAGLNLDSYSYYDTAKNEIDFAAMLANLEQIPQGDVVLLHGCCHNPTGADISSEEWDQVIDVLAERRLLPLIDIAYQGFGDGLAEDAYGVRLAIEKLPEVMIAASCSKNFGLYRERTGALLLISSDTQQTNAARSQVLAAARRSYSMSPYHGSGIVAQLLSDPELVTEWEQELQDIRVRMASLRTGLADGLNALQSKIDFDFVARSKGMFCYLGIPREDVLKLRSEYGIYLLESTRMNVAGLSSENLPIIIERVAEMLNR